MPGGRPTKYKEEYAEQAYKLCLLKNTTDADLAAFFDVDESTVNNWKQGYPEFFESIKNGKDIADAKVAASLFDRATGYSHPEDKIFLGKDNEPVIVPTTKHYPPDATSMIFWLKNRKPDVWRDKQELEHSGEVLQLTQEERQARIDELVAKREGL